MTTLTSHADIRPIDPAVVTGLRTRDDAGRRPRVSIDAEGGAPMRCCLRLSRPGERLALASYAPLRRWAVETGGDPGPYDEVGPVFIHADDCDGPAADAMPTELFEAHRMLRNYDRTGAILGGRMVEVDESPAAAAGEIFDSELDVSLIHVRAVEFGCFLFELRRTGG
jgi:hypothetical protein